MSFVDKTIFNIRARSPGAKKDDAGQNVSDGGHIFSQPFQNGVETQVQTPAQFLSKKIARILHQADLHKVALARLKK
ncbi:hypothetical protein COAQ111491_22005 [Comamonas aquatilis]|uniref:hypothetical protein n=1 Tax=Comamonas aquatilis TaxID=1778406 RepID=UPI0039F0CEF4